MHFMLRYTRIVGPNRIKNMVETRFEAWNREDAQRRAGEMLAEEKKSFVSRGCCLQEDIELFEIIPLKL